MSRAHRPSHETASGVSWHFLLHPLLLPWGQGPCGPIYLQPQVTVLPPGAGLGSQGGLWGTAFGGRRALAMKSRQKGKKKGASKERVFGCDLQEHLQFSGLEGKKVLGRGAGY